MPSKKTKFPISLTERFINAQYIESGAAGSVFKAHDQILQKDIAIKILPESASKSQIIRFQQEAKATSKLNHPNIVQIYNFDVNESGDVFMVIELIEGDTLKTFIDKNSHIDIAFSISIFQQICIGMHHAHEHNILHRDLKPGNILLTQDESSNYLLKIIDFGIAKVLDVGVELTTGNIAIGTPAYMSPEQGAGEEVDRRSDIYSFGCIMYEFITGEKIFKAETPLEILYKHAKEEVPELVHTFDGEAIPQQLSMVVQKCLAKDRENRFATFRQIEEELDQIIDELETQYTKQLEKTPKYQISKNKKTESLYSSIAMILLGLGVCAFFAYFWMHKPGNNPDKKMPVPATNSSTPTILAKQKLEIPRLSKFKRKLKSKELRRILAKAQKDKEYLEGISICNELLDRGKRKNHILTRRAKCYIGLAEYDEAKSDIDELLSIDKNNIDYKFLEARLHHAQKEFKAAIAEFTKLLELEPERIDIRLYRMEAYLATNQFNNSISDSSFILKRKRNLFTALKARAKSYSSIGEYKKEIADLNVLIKNHSTKSSYYIDRAEAYLNLKQYDKVIEDTSKVIDKNTLNHKAYLIRAKAYEATGQKEKAEADRQ